MNKINLTPGLVCLLVWLVLSNAITMLIGFSLGERFTEAKYSLPPPESMDENQLRHIVRMQQEHIQKLQDIVYIPKDYSLPNE